MNTQVLTRNELYDLVWSKPMIALAKQYTLSDVGLRKMCIRMRIPMPKGGHWQKLRFGKKVLKTPLPLDHDGEETVTFPLRNDQTPAFPSGESPLATLRHQIERDGRVKLAVPQHLTNPDKLIIVTKAHLAGQKPDTHLYLGTVSSSGNGLDVRVGINNIPRALRFLDTLIKALKARGHGIDLRNECTYVIVEGHDLKISLREKMRKEVIQARPWNRTVYHPTGVLAVQAGGYGGREWKDGTVPIEGQLPKILAHMELAARQWNEQQKRFRMQEEERKEREAFQKYVEERRAEELKKFNDMLAKATRSHKAETLRSYIATVEANARSHGSIPTHLEEWLAWAKEKADWYDPFIEREDGLLDDIDKETLAIPKQTTSYRW